MTQFQIEAIGRKVRQFLAHSYLYYRLDDSIIADADYDKLAVALKEELRSLQESQGSQDSMSSAFKEIPYADIALQAIGDLSQGGDQDQEDLNAASGFSIKKYPEQIIASALHLLYQHSYQSKMSFDEFLSRHGHSKVGWWRR